MIRQEVVSFLAVVVALLGVILLTTEREADDWRFGGYMLLAYLALSILAVAWRSTKNRD